jgi:tellurite resistance protein TerC
MFSLPDTLSQSGFLSQGYEVWGSFLALVVFLLALDLFVLNRKDAEVSPKKSLIYTGFYMALALIFGGWLWKSYGADDGVDYFTAYFIELSLSLDNLFVMSVILSYFAVPKKFQHRVLFWGVLGVLVMRGVMIGLGTVLIQSFDWVLFIFAGFLIVTGIKMLFLKDDDGAFQESALIRFFKRHLRYTDRIEGHKFFVKGPHLAHAKPVTYATPLFMALICIEFMDVLFALDSVPAVFAITTEPFVIYTSNIFAILGLRSMYFAITAVLERFKYMKYALSLVLVFIGGKVFYNAYIAHIPPLVSLAITLATLLGGALFSVIKTRGDKA